VKLRLGLLIAFALLVAACGGDDAGGTTTAAPETTVAAVETTTTVAETTPAAETTGAPAAGQAVAVTTSDLGEILVDSSGNTLYLFVPDDQSASTCYDACESNWPPLVGDVSAGDGADPALLGTVARDDGSAQATYNGWPLYYFANDAAPGDVNGQGINGVWYVVSGAGEAVEG
jgi:predicted lipoprotein with Yx(FWY)xxD motif